MKPEIFCQTTNRLNDEDFLQQVYQTYLKRDPDESGKNSYLQSLQEGKINRQQVIAIFLGWLILDELITIDFIIATILILLGVFVINYKKKIKLKNLKKL